MILLPRWKPWFLQYLDRVQGHRGRVTHCQPGLNLKVGKKRTHLGTPDPIWAKCSKSGQNFSRIGFFFSLSI